MEQPPSDSLAGIEVIDPVTKLFTFSCIEPTCSEAVLDWRSLIHIIIRIKNVSSYEAHIALCYRFQNRERHASEKGRIICAR
ncbi:MAG: hypothetical protein B6D70_12050 [gamma proteobacterium symbiont of Stewartia floridana]|nr:MAG: hypothetical protein B6D70_12050 [gamma proteobacterium symbiont of Stewartia floridana]